MHTATRCALLAALLGLLSVAQCFGTHITAGEISYRPDPGAGNAYTYAFTLKLYRDAAAVDQPAATLSFGVDGAVQTVPVGFRDESGVLTARNIQAVVYEFKYTYPGPGTYIVSFTEENRNANVVNMLQSVNTAFHIETTFAISPALGSNSSPQFLNPPVFHASVGQKVCMNPAAYDAEGDSLSYRLVLPLAKRGSAVNGYVSPHLVTPRGTAESGGESTFALNEFTGELCWDAPGPRKGDGGLISDPGDVAQYVVAFVVEEWRKGFRLSSTVRDFAIFVTAPPAPKPELRSEDAAAAGFNAGRLVRAEPGKPLSFSVLYKGSGASRDSLLPVSETFLGGRNAWATVLDSADFTKVKYAWTPTEADRRGHPYVIVFRGASGDASRNDLTFGVFVGADIPSGRVTATEDAVNGRWLRLFPNPTRNKMRLDEVPGAGAVHIELTDALGRQVYTSPDLRGTHWEMDLTALPNGLYAYTIRAGGRVVGKGRLLKR